MSGVSCIQPIFSAELQLGLALPILSFRYSTKVYNIDGAINVSSGVVPSMGECFTAMPFVISFGISCDAVLIQY